MMKIKLMTMSIRRFRHLPLLCALVLCLLTSPGGALGFVWCIGADGHSHATPLTAADRDCCSAAQATHADGHASGLTDNAEDHGQCLHVAVTGQLGAGSSRDGQALDEAPATNRSPLFTSLQPWSGELLTNGLIPDASPRVSEPLLLHRTTVLLI
jgi:hypothetical protein